MDENWYTNESVWSLSFFYPDLQGDLKKKKKKVANINGSKLYDYERVLLSCVRQAF